MKCKECGADLYEGIKKCPYCKTPTGFDTDGKFKDFDIKYTISSPQELKAISESVKGAADGKKSKVNKKKLFPFNIRRIEKTDKVKTYTAGQTANTSEKAKDFAMSSSHNKSEFASGTFARYTVREGDGTERQVASRDDYIINQYKRIEKAQEQKQERRYSNRQSRRKQGFNFNINKSTLIAGGIALLAIFVVVLGITAIIKSASNSDKVMSSYTYVKDNEMYMVYKGKKSKISEQVICDSFVRYAETNSNAVTPERAAKNANIVMESKDGVYTYFFDNFDPETSSGTLKLVKSGRSKKVIEISPAVHNSVVMSADGKNLLYLQTTDKNGDMGVLYYWNANLDEPFKIATDIDHGTFGFADEGKWAVFIQNLNRIEMQGDLYVKSLENFKDEKVKIDSAVCKIYGVNPGGIAYIYGKDYDKTDKTFDIYAMNKKGRSIRLGERTNRDPLMQKTKNSLFVYGVSEDKTSNLYTVEIGSGKKEKIASGVSSILMMSKDEKTVIYDKVYTGKLADYYAYTKGKQPQMIAHNVVVDYNAVAGKPQMAVDKDTTKILYISEFESFKGGGTLNLCTYKKGEIVSEEQIAEDVYAVYRAEDGKFIVAKDYSTSRKIFDLYVLKGNEISLLKEEVSPEMFGISNAGDTVYCVVDFGVEGKYGNLEKLNIKGEAETVSSGVFDFDITSENDLLIYKNLNTEDGGFDLNLRKNKKRKVLEIDTAIDEIIGF